LLRSVAADGHVIEVTRNALGQPLTVASPEVVYRYGYDAGHRLVSVEDSRAGKRLRYRWSPGGLLDARVDGEGGETVYRRGPLGRLSALALPGGEIWHWQRDLAGRPLELSSSAGVTRRYTWRADGRLAGLETRASGQRLSAHSYSYDGWGRRSAVRDAVGGSSGFDWRYSHDGRDMLTAAAFLIGTTSHPYLSWRFDALGTPTRVTHADGRSDRMLSAWRQVRQVDRHTAAGVREGTLARQSFDANGALLSKETAQGTLTLTWDARGQLASARTTGTNPVTETYGYDGLGRRISVTRNGVRTDWLYDGEHILAEYTGGAWASPSLRQVHGEGTDEILARTPLLNGAAQPTEYYAADGLGSLVALARADGSALRGNLRDAWGRTVWTAPGGALPPGPGFTGREQDTTGLVYYRARYYDPAFGGIHSGQFLSRDPLGLAGGINEYAYVGNDPLNHIDPDGLLAQGLVRGAAHAVTQGASYTLGAALDTLFPAVQAQRTRPGGDPLLPWGGGSGGGSAVGAPRGGGGAGAIPAKVAPAAPAARGAIEATGQLHHAISRPIAKELERHPTLAGQYTARDPRLTARAADPAAHRGYQQWHRELDREVVEWLRRSPEATPQQFESYLRGRYSQPDLLERFPGGLP
jgi:RHS repeat-associated protein